MPASAVEYHQQAVVGKCLGGLAQKPRQGFGIGLRFDRRDQATVSRRDSPEQVEGFADSLLGTCRSDLPRSPATIKFADPTEPRRVLKEQAQTLPILQRFLLFFRDFCELFLNGSTAAGSRLG